MTTYPIAAFYDLLQEWQERAGYCLPKLHEQHVVFVLMKYVDDTQWWVDPMGISLLNAQNEHPLQRELTLQGVGDRCLLLSGWYPERAEKRGVDVEYFIHLGRGAYVELSQKPNYQEFAEIAAGFGQMVEILRVGRIDNNKEPWQPPTLE